MSNFALIEVEPLVNTVPAVACRSIELRNVRIFYREAGPENAPVLLLLHGFPSSSFYHRNQIPRIASRYHVIAPDYPGSGHSQCPEVEKFESMLLELCQDNQSLVRFMRAAHETCERHNDFATASVLENWIDQSERRIWFLFASKQNP